MNMSEAAMIGLTHPTIEKRVDTMKRYSEKYKKEAVKRVVELKETQAHVARSLGISATTLKSWVRTYHEDPGQPFVGSGNLRNIEAKNRELERENRELKEINEILKKATAIFAADQKGSTSSSWSATKKNSRS
jgi:transposase